MTDLNSKLVPKIKSIDYQLVSAYNFVKDLLMLEIISFKYSQKSLNSSKLTLR
jgi:hypothetical protein